jgi:hypothetical protein
MGFCCNPGEPNTKRQSSHPVGIPFHAFLAIYVMFQDKIFEVDKWICFELFLQKMVY